MPQAAGTKAQAIQHPYPDKPEQKKLIPALQNASATGGQK
jgi:hypothetical protein